MSLVPRMRRRLLLALALAALGPAGCGYQFSGYSHVLPGGTRSLSIGPIDNESRVFGLDQELAFALEREVRRRGAVRLVETAGGADAALEATIRKVDLHPVAFDPSDEALQYEVSIVVDLTLRRSSDGEIVWHATGLRRSVEYSALSRVVVTSSSRFQQNTLSPGDLAELTDVQLAESERRLAVQRLLGALARDAYALMGDDF